ncbi:hypothetical protein FRB96_001836 [Tulasnella sp. 330]|nr:hypothetical protein FRB96_001836 [Tulasnella sp. 330]KAG8885173.1 hypothetical protein FRB97_001991 [Tulasnella sp. 331]
MRSVSTSFAAAAALGLIVLWALMRAIIYKRLVKLIALPGHRNIGPAGSSLYGLVMANLQNLIEFKFLLTRKHVDYERFGWDAISYISWFSSTPRFFIADSKLMRHISSSRLLFQKPVDHYHARVTAPYGMHLGIVEEGEWSRHKKITSRAFSEPNMRGVWDRTVAVVKDMVDSEWSLQGDNVVIDDFGTTTTEIAILAIATAAFGRDERWIADNKVPPGHALTFRQALRTVADTLIIKSSLPPWVWGSPADRDFLAVAGIAGRGWLGKLVKDCAVAYSELGVYMREMVKAEQSKNDQAEIPEGMRGNLFNNLVSAMGSELLSQGLGRNDLFGTGFETTAHALAYSFGLLALEEEEQQKLYDHIEEVLGDREPTFEDVPKLTRVLAVFSEATRLYSPAVAVTKCAMEDTVSSVSPALSEKDAKDLAMKDEGETQQRSFVIPKGSEIIFDVHGVHHNRACRFDILAVCV